MLLGTTPDSFRAHIMLANMLVHLCIVNNSNFKWICEWEWLCVVISVNFKSVSRCIIWYHVNFQYFLNVHFLTCNYFCIWCYVMSREELFRMLGSDNRSFEAQEFISVLITVYRSATFSSIIMEVPNFELCTIICCDLLENTFFTTFLEIWVLINTRASSEIYVVQVLKMPSQTVL